MNLTIDIGNSSAKAAELRITRVAAENLSHSFPEKVDSAIVVSTRGEEIELERRVKERVKRFVKFDHTTPVPVKNLYATPETLGYDRLAAAVGAWAMFPGQAALICDFGTAITYDIVSAAGEFLGGSISPGAGSRFRALHDYTGTLPLCTLPAYELPELPARDTKTAIESGVVAGIIAETEAHIEAAKKKFHEIKIIFTGGDAEYFAERVKSPIFATSDLVFYGLNAILEHNAKK